MLLVHRRASALAILPVAVIAASFAPGLSQWAVIFWAAGLCVMLINVALALAQGRNTVDTGRRVNRSRRVVATLAIFATAVVVGALLVGSQGASAATPAASSGPNAADTQSASVGGATPQNREGLRAIHGEAARSLVALAKARDAAPMSDLRTDFQGAKAFSSAGATIVSVPLVGSGNEIPGASNLTFVTTGGTTTVVENQALMIDDDHAAFRSWTDSTLTKEFVVSRAGAEAPGFAARGINWTSLNKCLSNAGISWALIAIVSASCGIACATAVLCLPCVSLAAGLTGGTVAKCVSNAFH